MKTWMPYTLPYLILALSWIGIEMGGLGNWAGVFLIFAVLPALEFLLPIDVKANTHQSFIFDVLLMSAFPVLSLFLLWNLPHYSLLASAFEKMGCILSVGSLMGVLSINVAHELVHRKGKWQKLFGLGLLHLVSFPHWGIEHVYGHHKNVATKEDPASSRLGEILYCFWLRNYFGGLVDAIKIEQKRQASKSWFGFLLNRIFVYYLYVGIIAGCVFYFWRKAGLEFWFGQSLVAIILLLTVDYIEHYGLSRKKSAQGIYEGVRPIHSWDSLSIWSNFALFNLALHSHHHWKANVPFPELREQKEALKMPFGYSVMVLVAFVPPLFFKLMAQAKQKQAT